MVRFVLFRPWLCLLGVRSWLVRDVSSPAVVLSIYSPELLNPVGLEEATHRAYGKSQNDVIIGSINSILPFLVSALPPSLGLWLQWLQPSTPAPSPWKTIITSSMFGCLKLKQLSDDALLFL